MRVMFVMTGAETGGAERFVAMLGRAWPAADTTKLVVLLGRGSLSPELEASFGDVQYLDIAPSSRRIDQMVRGLERAIADFQPDVVASHMFHADLVSALTRTHVARVSTVHTQGFGPQDRLLTKLIARAVGALSFRFKAVIPVSGSRDMQQFLRSLHMRNLRPAIPNGTEVPAAPAFAPDGRTLLSLARNHPVKGQTTLLRSFASVADAHPDWTLRLAGTDVTPDAEPFAGLLLEPHLAALAAQGRVQLTGPTTRPDLALAGAAALVISSHYGEATPMVGLEAAAQGVPVIATRVGSCPTFVDDSRFVAEPASEMDLARALATFMDLSDGERASLSSAARDRALAEYDARITVERYRTEFGRAMVQHG